MASPVRTTVPAVHTKSEKPSEPAALSPEKESTPSPTLDKAKAPPQDAGKPSTEPAKAELQDNAESTDSEDDVDDSDPINLDTFEQILELDEDEDDREFSHQMVEAYFSQVGETFKQMDSALESKDTATLSSLGHFLKGSSAALGVSKVQESCEKIQHYGHLRDEERNISIEADEALRLIRRSLRHAKRDYVVAEAWLKQWYEEDANGRS